VDRSGQRGGNAPRAKAQGAHGGTGRDRTFASRRTTRSGRGRNRARPRKTRSKEHGNDVNPQKRHEIFARLRAQNPSPRSELVYSSPFELLVAVVLSAQATDKSVNLATAKLYPVANTPRKIAALGEAKLTEYIRTIGLFRTKAKNVVALSKLLIDEHGGEVPASREALEALPGVGRKTANVVLNVAFGQPTIAVDTHIFRVANRTGIAPGKDPLEVEEKLLKFTPEEFRPHAHHWLILHGRYVCVARKPGCPGCVIRDLCEFRPKTKS
jgi:endonuclease-3